MCVCVCVYMYVVFVCDLDSTIQTALVYYGRTEGQIWIWIRIKLFIKKQRRPIST